MAMQLTWPQHRWICLAEDEDSSAAGPPKTLEELKAVLREVWASFTQNELEEMVESVPRRIHEIITKKGDATKYWHLPALALTFS